MNTNAARPAPRSGSGAFWYCGTPSGAVIEKTPRLKRLTDNTHDHPQYLALELRDRALVRHSGFCAPQSRQHRTRHQRLDRPLPENAVALKHLLHVAIARFSVSRPARSFRRRSGGGKPIAQSQIRTRSRRTLLHRLSRNKERALAHALEPETNVPEWFASITDAHGAEKAAAILAMHA